MSNLESELTVLSALSFLLWLAFGLWYWNKEKMKDQLVSDLRNRISRLEDILDENCDILKKRIDNIEADLKQKEVS